MTLEWRGDWHFQNQPDPSPSALALRYLAWAARVFQSAGVPPPGAGRMENARRLLQSIEGRDLRNESDTLRRRVANAGRLAWEMLVIGLACRRLQGGETPFSAKRLSEMMRGADDRPGKDPKGYSTQFELYVGALLALSGFGVRDGEPDLRMMFNGEDVAIACKRLNSLRPQKARKRLREALEQITGNDRLDDPADYQRVIGVKSRGFIAMNLDSYFYEGAIPLDDQQLVAHFDERARPVYAEAERLQHDHALIGVLFFGYLPRWTFPDGPGPGRLSQALPVKIVAMADDGVETSVSGQAIRIIGHRIMATIRGLQHC